MKLTKLASAFFMATAINLPTHAMEINTSGFFSITGGMTLDETPLYGYNDEKLDFKNESLGALQFTAQASEKVSATIQMLARGKNDFDIEAEWAFLNYKVSENLDIKGGRFRIPRTSMADYLDARHSYHWVREPKGVYSAPFTTLEGLRATYQFAIGDWEQTIDGLYGNYHNANFIVEGTTFEPTLMEAENWVGMQWRATDYTWSIQASAHRFDHKLMPKETQNGINNATGEYPELADNLTISGDETSYSYSFGVLFDDDEWLMQTEYTYSQLTGFLGEQYSFYISGGYHFGDFLVHLTYEDDDNKPYYEFADIVDDENDKQKALNFMSIFEKDSEAYSLGVRYDLDINTALKAQLTHDKTNGQESDLISFSMDYIF